MKLKFLVIAAIAIFFSACVGLKNTKQTSTQVLLPAEYPSPIWIKKINDKISIEGNLIFERNGETMRAYNLKTGKQVWKYYPDYGRNIRKFFVQDNYIVLDYDLAKYVLNKNTGEFIWKTTKDIDAYSSSFIQNGVLYYWLKYGTLSTVDLNTAKMKWEAIKIGYGQERFISDSTLVITRDYSQTYNERGDEVTIKNLSVYNLHNGKEIWKMDLNKPYVKNSPEYRIEAITANKIFAERNDTIFAFNAQDGTKLWDKRIPSKSKTTNGKNKLFAYNTDSLYCIDFNGNKMWEYEFTEKTATNFHFLQSNDNKLVFTSTVAAYCLDINGKEQWKFKFDKVNDEKAQVYSFIKEDMLYVETDKTYLLNMKGELLWKNDTLFAAVSKKSRFKKKKAVLLAQNVTIVQTYNNTIKAYDNSNGSIAWTYHNKSRSVKLINFTDDGTIFISLGNEGLLMACNNSAVAQAKIHKTPQGVQVYDYESKIFSSVKLPINGDWITKSVSANEILVNKGSDYKITALESGTWTSSLEDTTAAISSIKNSAGYLINQNDFHFRSDGERNKIEKPVFTTKIIQLDNGTKAVLVEAEIKITKPETSRIFGNSYYACIYYLLAKKEGKKTGFPVIATSIKLLPENYEAEKKKCQELLNHIANTAILSSEYQILK